MEAKRKYLDPEKKIPHDVHGCSSLSPCLNSHLEIYIVRHIYRREKKIRSVIVQIPICFFTVPINVRTYYFHRTVKYGTNRCRKIQITNRIIIIKIIIMMRIITIILIIKHCEGIKG
jgi:hypothetical protein